MAATIASTLDLSRPSEKFGTHSTMVDISEKHIRRDPHLQAGDLSGAGGLDFHQQPTRISDQVANLERLHQKWNVILFQKIAVFRPRQAGEGKQNVSRKPGRILQYPVAGFGDACRARHFAVDHHRIERLTRYRGFHLLGASDRSDFGPGSSQHIALKLQYRFFVFDQKNPSVERGAMLRGLDHRLRNNNTARGWQLDLDHRADIAAVFIAGGNFSAMFFDDAVTNAEPEACPLTHALGGVERLKNAVGFFDSRA